MKEYTFDKELAIANLRNIKKVLELINERRASVSSADDFLHSSDGMMRLDAICMNLIAIGEATKNLDKMIFIKVFGSLETFFQKGFKRVQSRALRKSSSDTHLELFGD
jgi:hypothetical protein